MSPNPQAIRPAREGFQTGETPPPRKERASLPAPADSPETTAPIDEWPVKVKLMHRPIRNEHGEEVRELSFREPTGGDINRCGNPVRVDQFGEIVIEERKMSLMIAALSGLLSPIIDRMDPRDWNSCAYRLRRFFLPDPEAWS